MDKNQFINSIINRDAQSIYNVCNSYSIEKYDKEFPPELFNNMMRAIRQTPAGIEQGKHWIHELYEEAKNYFMQKFVIGTCS